MPDDIGETIMAALTMPRRALWPELAVFANNPWKEDEVEGSKAPEVRR